MTFVASLEPQALWRRFDEILTIPRGSKQEDRMRAYVIKIADANGLKHATDAAGNVVVKKPASKGHERAPTVILQCHLDMVNEKNSDVVHDFDKDPIVPRRAGEYLNATGTTLGSDNGIGVAAMLALMDSSDVAHGPLELLFTIDEETCLTGASDLDPALLSGKILINLDSEEEYTVTVGCAGGANSELDQPAGSEVSGSRYCAQREAARHAWWTLRHRHSLAARQCCQTAGANSLRFAARKSFPDRIVHRRQQAQCDSARGCGCACCG